MDCVRVRGRMSVTIDVHLLLRVAVIKPKPREGHEGVTKDTDAHRTQANRLASKVNLTIEEYPWGSTPVVFMLIRDKGAAAVEDDAEQEGNLARDEEC